MLDLSSDDSGESKSKVLDLVDGDGSSKEGGLGGILSVGGGIGVGSGSEPSLKAAPPSPPQCNGKGQVAMAVTTTGGGLGLTAGLRLGLLLTQRVSVSRENSFGFFDPLTRACFQGHLRCVAG